MPPDGTSGLTLQVGMTVGVSTSNTMGGGRSCPSLQNIKRLVAVGADTTRTTRELGREAVNNVQHWNHVTITFFFAC